MRLNLAAMISLLNVVHLPYKNAVRNILVLSQTNDLPLYFHSYQQLFSVKCNDVFIENYDNSNTDGYRFGEWSGCFDCIETVNFDATLPPLSINEDYRLSWKIWNYFIGDDQYLYTDENGFELVPIVISDLDIYCDKQQLLASGLIEAQASLGNDASSTDDKHALGRASIGSEVTRKKLSKTEKQVRAFKTWLVQESNLVMSEDTDFYQACYRAIGKPTREEVWKELTEFAPDCFDKKPVVASIKKQNFFNRAKGGQSVVQFEGNSR